MTARDIIIEECTAYEERQMMRGDSMVEIDLLDDEKYWLCDYSESRGSAEPIKPLCDENEISAKEVIKICEENDWAYCF